MAHPKRHMKFYTSEIYFGGDSPPFLYIVISTIRAALKAIPTV